MMILRLAGDQRHESNKAPSNLFSFRRKHDSAEYCPVDESALYLVMAALVAA